MTQESPHRSSSRSGPPILSAGFRPFFLGGTCWAVVVIALWMLSLHGTLVIPSRFDPLAWHRHEMLFGYLGAVVAGFALTAIPNWTGRPPLAGPPLAWLVLLWVLARFAVLVSMRIGALPAMALDCGFLAALALVATREIVAARNRNLPLLAALALLVLAAAWDHAETLGWLAPRGSGWRLGFATILLLIALIGGRIIPAFTRNWLAKQGKTSHAPAGPNRFDAFSLVLLAASLLAWVSRPDAPATGGLLAAAGAVHAVRLARWEGLRTISDPLVFILHASYAWLPVGLLLLGASHFVSSISSAAAIHALAAGAMASMTLAVMTRATLGHTGRGLKADPATRAAYVLLFAGAGVRVAAPALRFDYLGALTMAAVLWGGAFVIFVLRYAPVLLQPRLNAKP